MPDLAPLPPLDTAPLFSDVHAELIALLRALEPADWERCAAVRCALGHGLSD